MTALVPFLPASSAYVSLRAPYALGRDSGWFASGHPFDRTVNWFETWLDGIAVTGKPTVLIGFSAGAAFAGGALLTSPARYLGTAILCGTLPFDTGLATTPGRLSGKHVFIGHSRNDPKMPHDLLDLAWNYLTTDSGAVVFADNYDGGHEITQQMLADLSTWLDALTAPS